MGSKGEGSEDTGDRKKNKEWRRTERERRTYETE